MAITKASDHSLTLAKLVAQNALAAAVARPIALRLANAYNLEGAGATAIDLSRFADIGTADSLSYGVEYTGEAAGGSTAVTITPTRRAKGMTVDKQTYLNRVSGYSADAVNAAINGMSGASSASMSAEELTSQAMIVNAAFGPELRQLVASLYETAEIELVGLFDNLSNVAGTSTSNFTMANFDQAIALLEGTSSLPHNDIVCCLDPQQTSDLRFDLRATTNSGAFSVDLASIVAMNPSLPTDGLRGAVAGIPIYQHGAEARLTANANADVVGAMFLRGVGDPEVSGAGQPGCFAMAVAHMPQIGVLFHPNAFGPRIVVDGPFAFGERVDAWGVAIITDAP
jgi:hypothetical protein